MNAYEEKKQARIERYRERAAAAEQRATELNKAGHDALHKIPFGQPILIGHHSEQWDRNYRNKACRKIERSFEESEKAAYYEQKASAVESNTAISSDDPEAIEKLEEKLAELQENHEALKAENKRRRKAGEAPYEWYVLPYSLADIKRCKERIAQLKARRERGPVEKEYDGFKYVENVEDNRVQFFFKDIPAAEIRAELKSNGFRWARSVGAWQRQLTGNGLWAAKCVIKFIQERGDE